MREGNNPGFLKRKSVDLILWLLWFPLRGTIAALPSAIMNPFLTLFSLLLFAADSGRRRGVRRELIELYGDRFDQRELKRIARSSFHLFTKRVFENLLFSRLDRKLFARIAEVEGLENVRAALEKGNGALAMQFHFGSFLLVPFGLAHNGINASAMAGVLIEEPDNYIKNKLILLRERELGSYPFSTLRVGSSLLPVVRALRKNTVIGLTIEGRQGANRVPIDILGRKVMFSTGLFELSIRSNVPILPTAVLKEKGKHRIVFEPEMKFAQGKDREDTLRLNIQKFVSNYEKYLLKYPDHFAMTLYSMRRESERGMNAPFFTD